MILDERLRWMGFWMLDKMKGGKTREYYDQIRYAWKEGSSVEETEKRIQNLIAHAVKTTGGNKSRHPLKGSNLGTKVGLWHGADWHVEV